MSSSPWLRRRPARAGVAGTLAVAAAFALIPARGATAADERRGLLPTDFYDEVTITETALSPDGRWAAFTVMTIVEDENRRHREIWIQELDGTEPVGEPRSFTSPTTESAEPAWSPDSKILTFQSKRGDDPNATWFLRVTAPGGEAFHLEGVEGAPVWSPDGHRIAYLDEPDETEADEADAGTGTVPEKEREGWIAGDTVTTTLDAERFDGRVITSTRYKRDGTRPLLADPASRDKRQLFVVDARGGEPRQITELDQNVSSPLWTADSAHLLFVADEKEDDEMNRDYTSDIYAVSIDGSSPRRLTSGLGREAALALSPKHDRLGYLWSVERGAPTDLVVVDVADDGSFRSEPKNLTLEWELSPGAPRWSADGARLVWTSQIGGDRHLMALDASGDESRPTTRVGGERSIGALSIAAVSSTAIFTVADPSHPTELYTAELAGGGERRLTSFNDDWLAGIERRAPHRLEWTVGDGTQVEGWLIEPIGHDPERIYPMILKIHGGPHSAYGNTWFRTFHVLSSSGFFVLYTNPRGSTGYGHDFTYSTLGRWGEMDSEDYLAGVDEALDAYPNIDAGRIGVSGGSYGGFMTAWLSATTDRFAAANPSRLIVNWESWYGTSDAQGLTEHEFGGEPWVERDRYRRLSPLSYVENVTIPTLIIHSEDDHRTPVADAEQWFMALRKRGVPSELVRYPRSSHGLSRTGEPWLLVDRLERIRSWFVHWLAPPDP